MKLSRIRAITFDAAGTLVVPHPSVGAVYAEIGRGNGLAVDGAELESRFRRVFKARRLHARTDEVGERRFWRELTGEIFAPWADTTTMDRIFPELWGTFAEARRWRPCADMPPVFAALRARGLRLAILSNWDSRLHSVIGGLGWSHWLDAVLISSELGVEKPSPEIFDKAAAILHATPHELLHVGDSIEHDISGALAAGWSAAWLDHGKPAELDPRALRLKSLAELPGLFAS